MKIYATKRELDDYNNRLDTMGITEIGESQAMMEIGKNTYISNLENVSQTLIECIWIWSFGTSNTHLTVMFII